MTTTAAPPERPVTRPPRAGNRSLAALRLSWRQFTAMRTALMLLFCLALAAIPGSILPQQGLNPAAVARYAAEHPRLAPVAARLGLFDVFASWWFSAIYLLLALSLIGCLVPRIRLHARMLVARPPRPPRRLDRLPHHVEWPAPEPPTDALTGAAARLRRSRWRVDVDDATSSLSAEKGHSRETGNLLFHISLLGLLVAIACGALFGYKGTVLVVEGDSFTNTPIAYDTLRPGRLTTASALAPFTLRLDDFRATYEEDGTPRTFAAALHWTPSPDAAERAYSLRVNHPLAVDGAKVYLLSHGFAPRFVVKDKAGVVRYDAPTPFLPVETRTYLSTGVVKVPDVAPGLPQLGFEAAFYPTVGIGPGGEVFSRFPDDLAPLVTFSTYAGDLGLDRGIPQNVYELDKRGLTKVGDGYLAPGDTFGPLPGGATITWAGYKEYAVLQVTHDPAKRAVLLFAVLALTGIVASLRIRRRRVWLRATGTDGGSVVALAGLARRDQAGFAPEFRRLAERLGAPPHEAGEQ
ncbi:MAG: cytochrome c biogenesis protein ResB [Frankia sp.]|nr:cytochrome c biogenesis protein ResB [Frankia sp.]